jgi:hypothetical protein
MSKSNQIQNRKKLKKTRFTNNTTTATATAAAPNNTNPIPIVTVKGSIFPAFIVDRDLISFPWQALCDSLDQTLLLLSQNNKSHESES